MAVGILNDKNEILARLEAQTRTGDPPEALIKRMQDLLKKTMDKAGITAIRHLGIGCPGILDRKKGLVLFSNNFHWENVPLASIFRRHMDIPIYMENDANCAALGEYLAGSGKRYDPMLMVTLGTGIGGGLIIHNKLYRGKSGNANIIGHITLSPSGGQQCSCGRTGCFETYASVSALVRMAEEAAGTHPDSLLAKAQKASHLNGKNIFEAIHKGDRAACMVFKDFVFYLSEGIADLINLLEPQAIILGGAISAQGNTLLDPLVSLVKDKIYCGPQSMPVILTSGLGNDAGIIGAACLDEFQ